MATILYLSFAELTVLLIVCSQVLSYNSNSSEKLVNTQKSSKRNETANNLSTKIHTNGLLAEDRNKNTTRSQIKSTEVTDVTNRIVISTGEIYRRRIVVSGYLIFGAVAIGLIFLGITHYLGKRELRKYNLGYGRSYKPVTRKDEQKL